METVDINELQVLDSIGFGSFGRVFKVKLDDKIYAFKGFYNEDRLVNKEFIDKISNMDKFDLNFSYIPKVKVKNNNEFLGYLTDISNSHDLGYLTVNSDFTRKVSLLKTAKNALIEIHKNGIVHADIHEGNFLLDRAILIDFDNCQYDGFYPNTIFFSDDARDFLRRYKFSQDIDYYLFNLMTYRLLNGISQEMTDFELQNQNYGIFDNRDARKICRSLLLNDKIFNTDLLIDTIDMRNIKKLKKEL